MENRPELQSFDFKYTGQFDKTANTVIFVFISEKKTCHQNNFASSWESILSKSQLDARIQFP
jgi:hypothetical protein